MLQHPATHAFDLWDQKRLTKNRYLVQSPRFICADQPGIADNIGYQND